MLHFSKAVINRKRCLSPWNTPSLGGRLNSKVPYRIHFCRKKFRSHSKKYSVNSHKDIMRTDVLRNIILQEKPIFFLCFASGGKTFKSGFVRLIATLEYSWNPKMTVDSFWGIMLFDLYIHLSFSSCCFSLSLSVQTTSRKIRFIYSQFRPSLLNNNAVIFGWRVLV